mmetsp:Transcript_13827/g.23587  ORF Transcript_13827/g.23587 Transcript_13827/m.23587 type:complete len:223 (+) Transcript_13827:20-688(+)
MSVLNAAKFMWRASLHVGGLGGRVSAAGHHAASHLGAHLGLGTAHFGGHHASLGGGAGSLGGVTNVLLEVLLEPDSLEVLLVLDLLLHVLVSLEQLVVLSLPELESLVEVGLELLLESVHLVLLLLDELGLSRDDLLVSVLHVLLALVDLHLLASHLDLVGFGILGLLSETGLDSLLVEELSAELKGEGQLLLQLLPVSLQLHGVSLLKFSQSLGVLLLGLE